MSDLIFLKLGGSLLTDKTGTEALRADTLPVSYTHLDVYKRQT